MKATKTIIAVAFGALALSGCMFGGNKSAETRAVEDIAGGSNPYLWRASLDTLQDLPLVAADPLGGTIIYDWKSYPDAMDERIKATVYILDSRLRADGVKVSVFRQTKDGEAWVDGSVDPRQAFSLKTRS